MAGAGQPKIAFELRWRAIGLIAGRPAPDDGQGRSFFDRRLPRAGRLTVPSAAAA